MREQLPNLSAVFCLERGNFGEIANVHMCLSPALGKSPEVINSHLLSGVVDLKGDANRPTQRNAAAGAA
jgi:hypothetical protein